MKKVILAYGDSNTYGYIPKTQGRYNLSTRWTGILAELLKKNYTVIEEGCNNRTGFYKNSAGYMQSGNLYIEECLKKHPVPDIFILAVGTNDLQKLYDFNIKFFENGLMSYIEKIKEKNNNVRIILIPPVKITKDILTSYFGLMFDEKSIENAIVIQDTYVNFARNNNIEFFDINEFAHPSEIDGLHYEAETHKIIAEKLAEFITNPSYSSNQDLQ